MKLAGSNQALLYFLLTTALVKNSNCLRECSSLQDEGTHFTITALSCINYTAVFSWNLEVNVADTQLELSCHNESSNFSPDIPITTQRLKTESFDIPLTGTAQCEIAGCYEDKGTYLEWLIPASSFTCRKPPDPVVTSSASLPPSPLSISPSPLPPTPTVSSTNAGVTPTSIPTQTSSQKDQRLVVIIAIPPSVASTLLVVVIVVVIFICRIQGKSPDVSTKYDLHRQQQDKFDPNCDPSCQSYYTTASLNTLCELPAQLDETSISMSTSTIHSESDSTSVNSQDPFPSLCSQLVENVLVEPSNTVRSDDNTRLCTTLSSQPQEILNDTHPPASETTYMHEPQSSVITSSNDAVALSCTQLERDVKISSHFSIPCLDDTSGIDTDEKWNSSNSGNMVHFNDLPHTLCCDESENTHYTDTDSGVQLNPTPGTMHINELHVPQLSSANDLNNEEVGGCDDEDEIMTSFAERYNEHTPSQPHVSSQNSSSGFSSQSYISVLNGRSTEH